MNRFGGHHYDGREILRPEGSHRLAGPASKAGYRPARNLGSVEYYVWRMLKSAAKRPSLDICCWKHRDRPSLHLFVARGALNVMFFLKCVAPQREQAVRPIFAQAGVAPLQDEVTGEAGDESRFLRYGLPGTAPAVAHLVAEFSEKVTVWRRPQNWNSTIVREKPGSEPHPANGRRASHHGPGRLEAATVADAERSA